MLKSVLELNFRLKVHKNVLHYHLFAMVYTGSVQFNDFLNFFKLNTMYFIPPINYLIIELISLHINGLPCIIKNFL